MNWLEGFVHKHTIICIVVVCALLLGFYKWTAHEDGIAHDARVLAEAQLKQDKDAQKAAESQAAKDNADYLRNRAIWQADTAKKNAQITALTVALSQRQAQDRALPPPELATRWEGIVGLVPGSVKVTPEGYLATLPAGTSTVVMLEEVAAEKQQIVSYSQIIDNKDKEIKSQAVLIEDGGRAVEACRVTLRSQESACEAEKKEIKATARKHGFWWAFGSFLAGVLAGHRF